ncbi:hypothetical protein, partial [Kocuria sp. NPDC057446]|uniref:hypothetical protein n=1 Tax=Kocuria sp. NPDC057446 TaxID=3346137 RepID=UPI0036C0BD6C
MRTRSEGWVQLGLRGIFRKNTEDSTPRAESGGPERPAGPGAGSEGRGTGVRDTGAPDAGHQDTGRQGPDGHGPEEHGPGEARPLPDRGPLPYLVGRLTARGADRAVLTLVQRGNTMTHQTEQSVGDAEPSLESGTVDQDSPLFDPVADLYSEAMSSPRGAWQTARIEVGPEQDGVRPVLTTYGFPDGTEDVRTWRSGRPTPGAGLPGEGQAAAGAQTAPGRTADGTPPAQERSDGEPSAQEQPEGAQRPAGTGAVAGGGLAAVAAAGTGSSATGAAHGPDGAASSEPAAEPARGTATERTAEPAEGSTGHPTSGPSTGAQTAPGDAPAVEAPAADGRADEEQHDAARSGSSQDDPGRGGVHHDVPDHVDAPEWDADGEPAAPTGA